MTREIADPAHPTPNPDGPHTPSKAHESVPVPARPPLQEETEEEEPYDSFFDDLNKQLSQSIERPAPDPALGPEGIGSGSGRADEPLAQLQPGQKLSPRTSEVFKAVVALSAGKSAKGEPGDEFTPDFLEPGVLDPETPVEPASVATLLPDLVVEERGRAAESTHDDESLSEARFPWLQVLILSYASALTLALTWVLLSGRTALPVDHVADGSSAASDSATPSKSIQNGIDVAALPSVPEENMTTLGSALRIGDLQVRPISVALARVELVGSIDSSKYRAEETESLVLRLQLTSFSDSRFFAPLERAYLREQASQLDRCFIATSRGRTIGAFPLAEDSEWSIVGQEFPVLKRGETVETIIASEPHAADLMTAEMTWRFRLRIGPYRTDVIGVRFRATQIERDSRNCGVTPESPRRLSPFFCAFPGGLAPICSIR
jgi:hypothetical protein